MIKFLAGVLIGAFAVHFFTGDNERLFLGFLILGAGMFLGSIAEQGK